MSAPLADAEARERIARDLDVSLVVEAAAGTGKTTALIGRIVALIESGRARLSEVAAVTFTEKAAGEMRLRLRAELERAHAGAEGDALGRLREALEELETARIGTIHGFCADLLRERPVEAGVDPDFEVLGEEEQAALIERAFDEVFEAQLASPPEGLRRLLRQGKSPRPALRSAARARIEHRDHHHPWRREPFAREAEIDRTVEAMRGLAALSELASRSRDHLADALSDFAHFLSAVDRREEVAARDHDALEAELRSFRRQRGTFSKRGYGERYGEGLSRADVIARRDAFAGHLDALLDRLDADLAACIFEELTPVLERYEDLLARSGSLDFLSLLVRARDVLSADEGVRQASRASLKAIFVDEFQDTDPLQAEILLILASEGSPPEGGMLTEGAPPPSEGKLFVVGDPKQSIYRFRRADVTLYERIKRALVGHGVPLLELRTSFRAPPSIQRAVNRAFASRFEGHPRVNEADAEGSPSTRYVALAPHREEEVDRPTLIALPIPRPYGRWGKVYKKQAAASTADAVGAFVRWLIDESGWTFRDPHTDERRPFESRDVCLLFRQMAGFNQDLTRPTLMALEARGVPHVLVGGKSFTDREEVMALISLLGAIESPDDPVRVYAALHGPFFALSDEALLVHRHEVGPLHPLVPLGDALFDPARRPVAEALELLRELHLRRNRLPIAETLGRLFEATRFLANLAQWPNGEQALANVLSMAELARGFESRGGRSFRAFVEHLEERAERGGGLGTPAVEERAAGVRVMTVHKAKGLEFPVVILCDPLLSGRSARPSRYVDSTIGLWAAPLAGAAPLELFERREEVLALEHAEEDRLVYVAATRARELLVVPACGDGAEAGWVDPLHAAFYPSHEARRAAEPAVGCPTFGGDSVLERPEDVRVGPSASVAPGGHRVGEGDESYEVVWWDPRALELDVAPSGGLRGVSWLGPNDPSGSGAARLAAYREWLDARRLSIERASEPSERARSVTAHALAEVEAGVSAESPTIEATALEPGTRPSGKRFGTLVHAILAEIALPPRDGEVRAMAHHQGRLVGADPPEVEAAEAACLAALAHPRLREAIGAEARGECRRETGILLPFEAGEWLEGIVDLAYRKPGGGWVVLDFKTDLARSGDTTTYALQLAAYARAIELATQEEVEAVLLYV